MLPTLAVNFNGFNGIIGLLFLVLFIVALISIITSGKDTGMKIIWIIIALVLPVIGPIL